LLHIKEESSDTSEGSQSPEPSVVTSKTPESPTLKQEDTMDSSEIRSTNEEDTPKRDNEDLPMLCDDDLAGKVPRENPTNKRAQRRLSLLTIDDLIYQTSERRSSLVETSFKVDDTCSEVQKRCNTSNSKQEDDCFTKATRRFSLYGIFESLANNSDYPDNEMADDEPLDHTVDNDINLLEIIHDISKTLTETKNKVHDKKNEPYDAFHTMPITDVYSSEEEAKLLDIATAL